ncbi:DUF6044 family protein [Pontibacter fetidus]|uniref:Uncharacterized protein n=1 Tax=Pontibacter fetidus TaxID=2700082 RepID=A0A6B2HA78_9BACT|nr:DUF6044 family protein [Pontibacter fetidus]NDK57180.1 hypothetical protein [Pontibacter fetidus]
MALKTVAQNKSTRYNLSQPEETGNVLFWIGLAFVILLFSLPRILLGEDSYITIHDNLDSELVWKMIMTEGGKLIGDNAVTQRVMNGFPSKLYPSQFNISVWFFLFLSPFQAYAVNEVVVHAIAFIGMFLLLKRFVLPSKNYNWIVLGVSVTFAALPFYSVYGLSITGQPFLLYAFLTLLNKGYNWKSYSIIVLYAFYSSLPLTGFFILIVLAGWFIVQYYQTRVINVPFLLGSILLGLCYVITEHNLLYMMLLESGYVSHRLDYASENIFSNDINELIKNTTDGFVFGNYHAATVHRPVLIAALIALIISWRRKDYRAYGNIMVLLVIAWILSLIQAAYKSYALVELKDAISIIKTFDFSRFFWFRPLVWFVTFALSLVVIAKGKKWGKVLAGFCVLLQLAFCLKSTTQTTNEFNENRHLLMAKYFGAPRLEQNLSVTYKEFYSEPLFKEIKEYINRPQASYRVLNIGFHPSIAQFNGFYTLDGYQNNYPLEYKKQFKKIIEEELAKNDKWQSYFDGWGSRFYILPAELDNYYDNVKTKSVVIRQLNINTSVAKSMGAEYIFSSIEIENAPEIGMHLEKVFEHKDSPWRIYLYSL